MKHAVQPARVETRPFPEIRNDVRAALQFVDRILRQCYSAPISRYPPPSQLFRGQDSCAVIRSHSTGSV